MENHAGNKYSPGIYNWTRGEILRFQEKGKDYFVRNLTCKGKGGIRGSKITALELNYTALSIAARGRKIVAGEINFHSREIVIEEQ